MQMTLVILRSVLGIVQVLTLAALVVTAAVAVRQLKAATEQARASDAQAKSSEQMAKLSLQQTELMRGQLHLAYRPIIEVTGGEYGTQSATLTLQNVGNSPALGVLAICRSGYQEKLGSLAPDKTRRFRFDHSFNVPTLPIRSTGAPEAEIQSVPLRLVYQSVSGAKCWSNIDLDIGHPN